jgi:phosphohistidine phosphatase
LKRLLVIRHAKSDWDSLSDSDFERPLNKRGLSDAPKMGIHLKEMALFPDLIISSGAKRAITTAKLIAKSLDYTNDILVDNNIYNASNDDINSIINKIDKKYNTVFLFGHNPGLSNLINELSGEWVNLKTCCIVELEITVDKWVHVGNETAIFKEYYSPKALS